VLHPVKVTPLVSQTHPDALSVFKDSCLVEFLYLQPGYLEGGAEFRASYRDILMSR